MGVGDNRAALFEIGQPSPGLKLFKGNDHVGLSELDNGGINLVAVFDIGHNRAAALAHAVNLRHLDVEALVAKHLTEQTA